MHRVTDEEAERICAEWEARDASLDIAGTDTGSPSEDMFGQPDGQDETVGHAEAPADVFRTNTHHRVASSSDGSAHLQPSSSPLGRAGFDGEGGWRDWVPRVTSTGQIYYSNVRTGEEAAELPSAEESDHGSDNSARLGVSAEVDRPGRPSDDANDDDDHEAEAFFDEHGFGRTLVAGPSSAVDSSASYGVPWRDNTQAFDSQAGPGSPTPSSSRPSDTGHAVSDRSGHAVSDRSGSVRHSAGFDRAGQDEVSPATSFISLGNHSDGIRQRPRSLQRSGSIDSRTSPSRPRSKRIRPSSRPVSRDPAVIPTVKTVNDRIQGALRSIVHCATSDSPDGNDRLGGTCRILVEELRGLLQMTGQLESSAVAPTEPPDRGPGSGSEKTSPLPTRLAPPASELRPAQKRVTSELSKLLTCVRAICALPGSPLHVDEDPGLHPGAASSHFTDRHAHELRLRRNCVISAHELAARLDDFVALYCRAGQPASIRVPRPLRGRLEPMEVIADRHHISNCPRNGAPDYAILDRVACPSAARQGPRPNGVRIDALHEIATRACTRLEEVAHPSKQDMSHGEASAAVDIDGGVGDLVSSVGDLVKAVQHSMAGARLGHRNSSEDDTDSISGSDASSHRRQRRTRPSRDSSSSRDVLATAEPLEELVVCLVPLAQDLVSARSAGDESGQALKRSEVERCLGQIRERLEALAYAWKAHVDTRRSPIDRGLSPRYTGIRNADRNSTSSLSSASHGGKSVASPQTQHGELKMTESEQSHTFGTESDGAEQSEQQDSDIGNDEAQVVDTASRGPGPSTDASPNIGRGHPRTFARPCLTGQLKWLICRCDQARVDRPLAQRSSHDFSESARRLPSILPRRPSCPLNALPSSVLTTAPTTYRSTAMGNCGVAH